MPGLSGNLALALTRRIGRYDVLLDLHEDEFVSIAAARVRGPNAGPRLVELTKVDALVAREAGFQDAFLAEARGASGVRSPHFAHPFDTLVLQGEIYSASEFMHAVRYDELLRLAEAEGCPIPVGVCIRILCDVLKGLTALHATLGPTGRPLVHGDVAPCNILVGYRGLSRLVHSGLSHVAARVAVSPVLNSRLSYKAPEQLRGNVEATPLSPAADVFAVAVLLWEALARERLFVGESESRTVALVLRGEVREEALLRASPVSSAFLPLLRHALHTEPARRHRDAADFFFELEQVAREHLASEDDVTRVVDRLAGEAIDRRRGDIEERASENSSLFPSLPPPSEADQPREPTSEVREKPTRESPRAPLRGSRGGAQQGRRLAARWPKLLVATMLGAILAVVVAWRLRKHALHATEVAPPSAIAATAAEVAGETSPVPEFPNEPLLPQRVERDPPASGAEPSSSSGATLPVPPTSLAPPSPATRVPRRPAMRPLPLPKKSAPRPTSRPSRGAAESRATGYIPPGI